MNCYYIILPVLTYCGLLLLYSDLKSQLQHQTDQLQVRQLTIDKVKADHSSALDFSMAEKNREIERLRRQLEAVESKLEATDEAQRLTEQESSTPAP
jgi:hypothetical protein